MRPRKKDQGFLSCIFNHTTVSDGLCPLRGARGVATGECSDALLRTIEGTALSKAVAAALLKGDMPDVLVIDVGDGTDKPNRTIAIKIISTVPSAYAESIINRTMIKLLFCPGGTPRPTCTVILQRECQTQEGV
jgi:hypothetical protein